MGDDCCVASDIAKFCIKRPFHVEFPEGQTASFSLSHIDQANQTAASEVQLQISRPTAAPVERLIMLQSASDDLCPVDAGPPTVLT
jgi:hypothetical protein